jgi:predicted aspartyl protease
LKALVTACMCIAAIHSQLTPTLAASSLATPRQTASPANPDIAYGASLFRAGRFVEARAAYARAVSLDPNSYDALLGIGKIDVLRNDQNDAELELSKARLLRPDAAEPKALLAEMFYRRADFRRAAPLFREIGQSAKASQLASFGLNAPYRSDSGVDTITLKFVMTDPLPVIQVKVNGHGPVNFLIDTGAAEVILDPEFAGEVGATSAGTVTGTYAGGLKAEHALGRVDSITFGSMTLSNVPVQLLGTRAFSSGYGRRIDGMIGTVLLYHFCSTLDLRDGELVLRPKSRCNAAEMDQQVRDGAVEVPFWMAGDHFMVAWGAVNRIPELLMVDTGLSGGGFVGPESTLRAAQINVSNESVGGLGGGGEVTARPLTVDQLSLGATTEKDIKGFAGVFAPMLEDVFGFRIGGIISHTFFRAYSTTFDFVSMRLVMAGRARR